MPIKIVKPERAADCALIRGAHTEPVYNVRIRARMAHRILSVFENSAVAKISVGGAVPAAESASGCLSAVML